MSNLKFLKLLSEFSSTLLEFSVKIKILDNYCDEIYINFIIYSHLCKM